MQIKAKNICARNWGYQISITRKKRGKKQGYINNKGLKIGQHK